MDVCLIWLSFSLIPNPGSGFGFSSPHLVSPLALVSNRERDQGQMLPLFGREAILTQPSAKNQMGLLK